MRCLHVQTLNLCNIGLTGELPVLWGVNASFPALVTLDISRNILSGEYFSFTFPFSRYLQTLPCCFEPTTSEAHNAALLVGSHVDLDVQSYGKPCPETWLGQGFSAQPLQIANITI